MIDLERFGAVTYYGLHPLGGDGLLRAARKVAKLLGVPYGFVTLSDVAAHRCLKSVRSPKVRYDTLKEARAKGEVYGHAAYPCKECLYWHLTSSCTYHGAPASFDCRCCGLSYAFGGRHRNNFCSHGCKRRFAQRKVAS